MPDLGDTPSVTGRHPALETHLTERTGSMLAEAVGLLATRLLALVLAGIMVWAVVHVVEDSDTLLGLIVGVVLFSLLAAAFAAIGLLPFRGLARGRLRGARDYRRPSRVQRQLSREESAGATTSVPMLPPNALLASPHGQGPLVLRTVMMFLLGAPAVVLAVTALRAYAVQLLTDSPRSVSERWAWHAPSTGSGLGAWFFTGELMEVKALATTASFVALCAGLALLPLLVPLLRRRGTDAIDLALSEDGIVVRGGLTIGWDELDEVLVVRDLSKTKLVGPRDHRVAGQTKMGINPTYLRGHSRTRIALVPWDMGSIARRVLASRTTAHLALRVDRELETGYVLCDVWVHSPDVVADVVSRLRTLTARHVVDVVELARGI